MHSFPLRIKETKLLSSCLYWPPTFLSPCPPFSQLDKPGDKIASPLDYCGAPNTQAFEVSPKAPSVSAIQNKPVGMSSAIKSLWGPEVVTRLSQYYHCGCCPSIPLLFFRLLLSLNSLEEFRGSPCPVVSQLSNLLIQKTDAQECLKLTKWIWTWESIIWPSGLL